MNTQGAGDIIRYITKGKLEYHKEVVNIAKEVMGLDPNQPLPDSYKKPDGTFDPQKIKDGIVNAVVNSKLPQLKGERDQAKAESDKLKEQIDKIVKELGLDKNATTKQVLDKIKELMNRPSSAVIYQKNSEIAQKDSEIADLKQQLAAEKQKNTELQSQINNSATHEVIVRKIKGSLANLGISSAARTSVISNSLSSESAVDAGNKLFEEEWKKERNAKKQAFYLNIALIGLLALTLLALTWLIMKGNKLPIKEEDEEKIKK